MSPVMRQEKKSGSRKRIYVGHRFKSILAITGKMFWIGKITTTWVSDLAYEPLVDV